MNTLKRYFVHLKSISPLVLHNDTLANPLSPMTKKMKEISSLKTKQDAHYLAMAKIEWEAGLYYEEEIGLYISSKMLSGCFKASAKKEKKGKDTKGIIIDCVPGTPILPYEGMTPESLWNVKNKKGEQVHVFTESVRVQRARVMRTRPIFPSWEAKFEILLDTEILEENICKVIIERAGFEYGLGELRPQLATGICGRFKLEEMREI